ncbi:hypothetical protein HYW36_01545 [Candidatus Saccharibacteria bacterium]|nr:hypothetical protein [Candidatus Saccharibacteria bacterium]
MPPGLKIIRTIQSTNRFEAYEAEYRGQKVFAKKAKADKARELLARVPENSETANRMGQKTDFKFRAPQIYAQNEDWIVTEWIKGGSLGNEVESNPAMITEVLVNFLIVLDKEPASGEEIRKTFKSDSLAAYMAEKLPKNLTADQRKVVSDAKTRFDTLRPTLVPAWQDGDIKPDHIFADPNNPGGFVLVDPEHLDPRWPRFYSLANNFVKYWVRGPKEFSANLVVLFMQKSGLSEDEVFRPLLASIIVRGISLHWEPDYDPGAEQYNVPRSQAMLKVCQAANNFDDLLY